MSESSPLEEDAGEEASAKRRRRLPVGEEYLRRRDAFDKVWHAKASIKVGSLKKPGEWLRDSVRGPTNRIRGALTKLESCNNSTDLAVGEELRSAVCSQHSSRVFENAQRLLVENTAMIPEKTNRTKYHFYH